MPEEISWWALCAVWERIDAHGATAPAINSSFTEWNYELLLQVNASIWSNYGVRLMDLASKLMSVALAHLWRGPLLRRLWRRWRWRERRSPQLTCNKKLAHVSTAAKKLFVFLHSVRKSSAKNGAVRTHICIINLIILFAFQFEEAIRVWIRYLSSLWFCLKEHHLNSGRTQYFAVAINHGGFVAWKLRKSVASHASDADRLWFCFDN